MGNRAKSQMLKKSIERKAKDDLQAAACAMYLRERETEQAGGVKGKSLRAVCTEISNQHFANTGHRITLNPGTLSNHAAGHQTMSAFNAKKHHLSEAEQKQIVDFAIELGDRGFPLSPRRLREHAEHILRKRLGHLAPENGLGKGWTSRFITKHHDRLGRYWSRPLDSKRGRAVNPHTKAEFFEILKDCREKFNIPDELVYGGDETGIQQGVGTKEYVVGGKGKSVQHQQREGNRENITVLPTICADGSNLAPAVIFKGEGFQAKWEQNNPLDARCVSNFCDTV